MKINPETVIYAYANGIFPMSDGREDQNVYWVNPETRGILPLDDFHISHSLRKTIRNTQLSITVNKAFEKVICNCAAPASGRWSTWINYEIQEIFTSLHTRGFAHSVEAWNGNILVGGLYGVALGKAFFGESMFSSEKNASKIALAYLVALLRKGKFSLLDIQFVTNHLRQFGAIEVIRADYQSLLSVAIPDRLSSSIYFKNLESTLSSTEVLQSITQTS